MSDKHKQQNDHQTRMFGINITTVIPFIKMRWFSFALSGALIIAGATLYIMRGGFNLGIDFKGGVKVEVQLKKDTITIHDVRKVFSDKKMEADINTVGIPSEKHFMITLPVTKETTSTEIDDIMGYLDQAFGQENVTKLGSELVEPKIGKTFSQQAFQLLFIAALLILLYVIFRFDFFYGAGAVGALLHDVLMMLSFAMFFNVPIDITVIAAILTILGYSINDTIVVFDRIRELHAIHKDEDYEIIMDKSITQTLSRTIITSLTVFFVVLAIYLMGGIVLKNFSFMMLVGVIDGTYSSIFIAAPITYMIRTAADKKLKAKVIKA